MDFKAFTQQIEEQRWKIHGIQVSKDSILIGKYHDVTNRYPIYSATKTITSTAVGIAVDEKKFSIEESLYEYVKHILPVTIDQKKIERLKRISIERLLTMSVKGFPFRPEGEDWLEYSIECMSDEIDTIEFDYSNISAYLVGVALQCALSEHLMDYLQPRLFEPLDIKEPDYQNCPRGYYYGASGMKLSVDELSRIGELYLKGGSYKDYKILSKDWVENATSMQIPNREGGYGYYIWRYRDGYRISGKWGQRCIVIPKDKLVVTYLSDMESGSGEVTKAVEKYVL